MRRIAPVALAFVFLLPTVAQAQEDTVVVTQCQVFNTWDYNADRSCFDTQPRPRAASLVPLNASIEGTPKPVTLAIKVKVDGTVELVLPVAPSDNPAFTEAAIVFAVNLLTYQPAQKDGQPVVGWTQQIFFPVRRQ